MPTDLEALEALFLVQETGGQRQTPRQGGTAGQRGTAYERRLESLRKANGGRYERCLHGDHEYPSDSEASLAVVDAMVARHFSDGEIWQTLEGSPLFQRRVEKKGENHARELYQDEIVMARLHVTPFADDPGGPSTSGRRTAAEHEIDELPEIVITDEHLHRLSDAAWQALVDRNVPPFLFQHAGAIAQVRQDEEGRHLIKDLSVPSVRGLLDRSAYWMRSSRNGLVPARPPRDVIEDMLALDKPLPVIRGIVGTPLFSASGELVTTPGYQPTTGLFYVPVGAPVRNVPQKPCVSDIEQAKALIFREWLGDFPFVDTAARTHFLAGALTPLAREMILGPTPLLGLDAPAPGTGKGLLADTLGVVITGTSPAVMNDTRVEDEIRKRITSVLKEGHPLVLIDNVKRRVVSYSLAALLTSTFWADRLLGGNEMARLPNRSLWVITGNNLDFDFEIARRTIWSRLDAKVDRPAERTGFRHDPLAQWVQANRHELVWALLTLLQNWIAAGRPVWTGPRLGSYESWCDVIGGTLAAAGIDGFLANRDELYRQADSETDDWRAFVGAWWEEFGGKQVKAAQLLSLTQREQLLLSLFATARDNATERSLVTRLGTALAARRDRRFGPFFIKLLGKDAHAKGTLYRLEPAKEGEPMTRGSARTDQGSAEVPQGITPISDSNAEPAEPAEPKSHVPQECDKAAGDHGTEHNPGAAPFKVPQVPHVPQLDSKEAIKAAEPMTPSGTEVPQEVPQEAGQVELFGSTCSRCSADVFRYDSEGLGYCRAHWLARSYQATNQRPSA